MTYSTARLEQIFQGVTFQSEITEIEVTEAGVTSTYTQASTPSAEDKFNDLKSSISPSIDEITIDVPEDTGVSTILIVEYSFNGTDWNGTALQGGGKRKKILLPSH